MRTALVTLTMCLLTLPANAKYSGGTGEPSDPYQIATAADLIALGETPGDYDKHFILTADLDLGAASFGGIGTNSSSARPFSGTFDGNYKTIANLAGRNGLFGSVEGTKASIMRLRLTAVSINGGTGGGIGALASSLLYGRISRCYVEGGSVSGAYAVGGLVGVCRGTIIHCSSAASISTSDGSGGGLVGDNMSPGTIIRCRSIGQVSARSWAGGLVGENNGGTISDCYSTARATATKGYAGGLIASNYGIVYNCYSAGAVSAPQFPGGLIGSGGGQQVVTSSFWDIQASGRRRSAGGTGKNTVQMKTAVTFAGWDFASTWTIQEGVDYPRLQWEADPSASSATAIEKVSGDGQRGVTGSTLAAPLTVRVTDQVGEGMAGVEVRFTVVAGDGTVEPASAVTNAAGFASTELTLGSIAGPVQVRAAAGTLAVDFNATALAVTSIEAVSGNNQSALAGSKLAAPLRVRVKDQLGGGVAGVEVQFTVMAGDGTVAPASAVTDAAGLASTELTLGPAGGPAQVRATVGTLSVDFNIMALAAPGYSGGKGTADDPYQIATGADLIAFGETPAHYDKRFILTADIDLDPNLPGGKVFDRAVIAPHVDPMSYYFQGTAFTGVFDGNDHTIRNLKVTGATFLGLFGSLGSTARVANLGLEAVEINGTGQVGGLAGFNKGSITNSYSTGSVSGIQDVGGLVGVNDGGSISSSYSGASASGEDWVGGLVGDNYSGSIVASYSSGSVSGTGWSVGGLAGDNWGSIVASYSSGPVSGTDSVGGLAGGNGGSIVASYSSGSIIGTNGVGGLVGRNSRVATFFWPIQIGGSITNSYSTGAVGGKDFVGGLVGDNEADVAGSVGSSFWDIQTSGWATSAAGTGKTTAEMMDPNTFMAPGWDFVGRPDGPRDIWAEPEGGGYPILSWQLANGFGLPEFSGGTGEPNHPYRISRPEELNRIADNPRLMKCHFILVGDLDLTGLPFYPIGSSDFPYTGVFDGNDLTASHLTIEGDQNLGLFGYLAREAEVRNVRVVDANITGSGGSVGVLAGYNAGSIVASSSSGSIGGDWSVGGLVGANYGSITASYGGGSVTGTGWGVGGLAGSNGGSIVESYSSGSVTGTGEGVGGLAGHNWGSIATSYSSGAVDGTSDVGGLVGKSGENGRTTASFWDLQTSSQTTSAGGTGKTTAEMQTAGTFLEAGWDFAGETANGTEDIWWIDEGKDYPRLWWEGSQLMMDD